MLYYVMCYSKLCYVCASKLCWCIEFATTHVAFLVNICVANKNINMCICYHTCYIFLLIYMCAKNTICVFAILVANYIGVFDSKLS
jgi:hypothetical protein